MALGLWFSGAFESEIRGADTLPPQIGEVVTTIPTIGFNVESVTYKNLNLNVWVCFTYLQVHLGHN
jgi:hypothetical protein